MRKYMEKELENQEKQENPVKEIITGKIYQEVCPVCGGTLVREGHCAYCPDCGNSLCSI
jgi:rubrerythrin